MGTIFNTAERQKKDSEDIKIGLGAVEKKLGAWRLLGLSLASGLIGGAVVVGAQYLISLVG